MNSVFSEDNLYLFTLVAKYGNLSKAADELGITASAVSYAIKRIENHLGIPLFIRTTRTVKLTEAGKFLNQKATSLLNEFQSIERSLNSINRGMELKVRICINNLLYRPYHTSRLLHCLKSNFPSCQFIISTEVYNGVWDALLNKNIDVAIGAPGTLVDGGGIDYLEIGEIHWCFVVPPHHPLAKAPEPIPESLLRTYPNAFIEDTAINITKRVGWVLHGQETIKVTDWDIKRQIQLLGTGIGFLPDYLVADDIASGAFVEKKIKNPRQASKMLLAIKHDLKGEVGQWIQDAFKEQQLLRNLYSDLMHQENR